MKQLRLVHYPQIPCEGFKVPVKSVEEACKIAEVLAGYDLFQLEKNIKPDYNNMTVLEEFDEDSYEWIDWYDDETGLSFSEYLREIR